MRRKRKNFAELSPEEQQALLFERACDYLSRREHSEKELRIKLRRKYSEVSKTQLDSLLSKLKEIGFQSDDRFTESFVRSSIWKRYGPRKIKYELGGKGVAKDKAQLDEINFRELALQLTRRKYAKQLEKYSGMTFEEKQKFKAKICRMLSSKGHMYEDMLWVVKELTG